MSGRADSLPATLELLIVRERIAERLKSMASEICSAISRSERPIAVVVLQGGFVFAADLLRELPPDFPIEVAFLRCESYRDATYSSGKVLLLSDIDAEIDLRGRTVLLIDDILDTGHTLKFLADHLQRRGAAKVRLCVLLKRKANAEDAPISADFFGFAIG